MILDFSDITIADLPRVGGKNASLGELFRSLEAARRRGPRRFRDDSRRLSHVREQIDSISLNPDTVITATLRVAGAENALATR